MVVPHGVGTDRGEDIEQFVSVCITHIVAETVSKVNGEVSRKCAVSLTKFLFEFNGLG